MARRFTVRAENTEHVTNDSSRAIVRLTTKDGRSFEVPVDSVVSDWIRKSRNGKAYFIASDNNGNLKLHSEAKTATF